MNYDPNNILNSEETNFVKLSVYQSLEAENARLKAEVERLEIMKERLDDARKVIDDLHAITKTSNADKLVEFVQGASDTIGAQLVELDDLRARFRCVD